jgi:hypothetical protein
MFFHTNSQLPSGFLQQQQQQQIPGGTFPIRYSSRVENGGIASIFGPGDVVAVVIFDVFLGFGPG